MKLSPQRNHGPCIDTDIQEWIRYLSGFCGIFEGKSSELSLKGYFGVFFLAAGLCGFMFSLIKMGDKKG